jgi:transcriptional regulator with XRE-family HTH domain
MWLENLKELKQKSKMTYKDISAGTRIPPKTIERIFNGYTESPTINTLIPIISFLGGNFSEVFADTQAVVGNATVTELEGVVEEVKAEKNLVVSDYELLLDKYSNLEKELERTKTELAFTKKLLAVHEHYTKLKCE